MKKEYKKPFVQIKESQAQENPDKYIRKIKASDDMMMREVAGEYILIPVGEMALKVHGMISMSESGALLWKKLQEECTENDLVDEILKEYSIDRDTAKKDVQVFVQKMRGIGILVEANEEIEWDEKVQ